MARFAAFTAFVLSIFALTGVVGVIVVLVLFVLVLVVLILVVLVLVVLILFVIAADGCRSDVALSVPETGRGWKRSEPFIDDLLLFFFVARNATIDADDISASFFGIGGGVLSQDAGC